MNNYITPPNNFAFLAKELFSNISEVKWGALAHLDKNGVGPIGDHTHEDNLLARYFNNNFDNRYLILFQLSLFRFF